MSAKQKKNLYSILTGAGLYLAVVLAERFMALPVNVLIVLYLAVYFYMGHGVLKKAVHGITHGQMLDENFLMSLATVGALVVGEYPEAIGVMLFYRVGEWFENYAVGQSRKAIAEVMSIRPDEAVVLRNGSEITCSPEEVMVGETIVVRPGERIPIDGIIVRGDTTLDTKELTGESIPRDVFCGEAVVSGCVNLSGVIEIRTTKQFSESTVSRILELVEDAAGNKSKSENFITKFARVYTPLVVAGALILALVMPVVLGQPFTPWVYRGLTFLVVSCPCALVISIPLSFFGGIGGAGRLGVLIKGSNYLEALNSCDIVLMDKTGTITRGNFRVSRVAAADSGFDEERLLRYAALAESGSLHPIAMSLKEEYTCRYGAELSADAVSDIREIQGRGISCLAEGHRVLAGNERFMRDNSVECKAEDEPGTVVYLAVDNRLAGWCVISDEIKESAKDAVSELRKKGVSRIVMLSGDLDRVCGQVAAAVGITEYHSGLLPGDKVELMKRYLGEKKPGKTLVFVGDGTNDAPVLAGADIGVAMGGLGSDAAIEAADIVIMNDDPCRLPAAMDIAGKTLLIVRENIVFAIGVKVLILLMAALGMANMWLAVFGDVGVAFIAILNAMRSLMEVGYSEGYL